MGLHSIFRKKQPEATSVADALAGATVSSTAKIKRRKSDARNADAQDDHLLPEKKRARRRLIGAIAMVLAVVIGLPMVLDSEPKSTSKNIVIQIPSKDVVTASPNTKPQLAHEAHEAHDEPETVDHSPESAAAPPIAQVAKPEIKPSPEPVTKKETPASAKEVVAESKPAKPVESTDSARAIAILDGTDSIKNTDEKPAAKPTTTTTSKTPAHLTIQIGAFATQEKVTELRGKLSAAGIKSYTQKVATSSGDKIRVRVGPFNDKESADKVKAQIEKLGLNGTVMAM